MPDISGERFTAMSISLPWRGVAVPPEGSSTAADRTGNAYYYAFAYVPESFFIGIQSAAIVESYATGTADQALATGTIIDRGLV